MRGLRVVFLSVLAMACALLLGGCPRTKGVTDPALIGKWESVMSATNLLKANSIEFVSEDVVKLNGRERSYGLPSEGELWIDGMGATPAKYGMEGETLVIHFEGTGYKYIRVKT